MFRATDSNLKRSVAIKVLPAAVAADADRLARFQREAEVLAALNHPNIAAIYGLEKTAEFTALVMELVEGDDLSQRIARGAIRSMKRCRSRSKSPRRWKPRTSRGSSIAISNPQTSRCGPLEPTGEAIAVVDGFSPTRGPRPYHVSSDGTLVYRATGGTALRRLTWFDRSGQSQGTVAEPGAYNTVALSPDGTRVVASRADSPASRQLELAPDLWIYDVMRGSSTRS